MRTLTLDQAIQIASAVGTIAVAILAIWGERIKLLFGLGPKLVLTLHDPHGELTTASKDGQSTLARYYHLRVSNQHRWTQATNVRVVIVGLAMPAADGNLVNQPLSGPLQLMWQFSNFHLLYSILGPDDFCDLGYILRGSRFELTPYVFPRNFTGVLERNQKMRVEVKAVADNAESKSLCVDISWDGTWSDDTLEMAKHLVVKEVSCNR
jgi:hypothetical protein